MITSAFGSRLELGSFGKVGQVVSIPETGFEALKLGFPSASSALKQTIFPLSYSLLRVTESPGVYERFSSQ